MATFLGLKSGRYQAKAEIKFDIAEILLPQKYHWGNSNTH